jgi:predicted flap endonuclease-1-like 5' DNA nuclease
MLWQHIRYWIQQNRSSREAVAEPVPAPPEAPLEAPAEEPTAAETISSWRYRASLSVFTPLIHLRKDGQQRAHHPSHLQLISNPDLSHGDWIPYRPDGFVAFSAMQQSQIDNLIADAGAEREQMLRFLIRFREIFESKVLHIDQKLMQIYALADKPEFAQAWQSVQVDHFPDNVFLAELTKLRGIGSQKASLLWQAGLRTPGMVQTASDQDLLAIRGIGPKLIAQLRAQSAA